MTNCKIIPVTLLILVISVICIECNTETTTHEDLSISNPDFDVTSQSQVSDDALTRVKRHFGYPYGYGYGYPYYGRRPYYPYPVPIIVGGGFGPGFGFGRGYGFGGRGFGGRGFGGRGFGGGFGHGFRG